MNPTSVKGRTLTLLAVIISLLVLFIYVALRSGPLAPVAVTLTTIESKPLTPSIFGIGTIESRYSTININTTNNLYSSTNLKAYSNISLADITTI